MFEKKLLIKTSDNLYICYDEEDTGWYLSLSKKDIVKFDSFSDFEATYNILSSYILYGHTEFSIELLYVKDNK